ncbi:MAG TPA: hypothetical protein VND40_05065 [Nitrososphaerales archaeon]|nr:hypothetical protein [Nitrososphaerales archaeon]
MMALSRGFFATTRSLRRDSPLFLLLFLIVTLVSSSASIQRAYATCTSGEHIFSTRYQRMMKIANADRMRRSWPSYIEEDIARLSTYSSVPAITKYLLDAYNIYKQSGTLRSHMLRHGIVPIPGRRRPRKMP